MRIAQPVLVQSAGFQGEAQRFIVSLRLFKILHRHGDVINALNNGLRRSAAGSKRD